MYSHLTGRIGADETQQKRCARIRRYPGKGVRQIHWNHRDQINCKGGDEGTQAHPTNARASTISKYIHISHASLNCNDQTHI